MVQKVNSPLFTPARNASHSPLSKYSVFLPVSRVLRTAGMPSLWATATQLMMPPGWVALDTAKSLSANRWEYSRYFIHKLLLLVVGRYIPSWISVCLIDRKFNKLVQLMVLLRHELEGEN